MSDWYTIERDAPSYEELWGDQEAFAAQQEIEPGQSRADLLPCLDLASLATIQPAPKVFAIERLAPLGEVTLFTGPGSAGKSLLAQQLATAAAAGLSCLGLCAQRVCQHGRGKGLQARTV